VFRGEALNWDFTPVEALTGLLYNLTPYESPQIALGESWIGDFHRSLGELSNIVLLAEAGCSVRVIYSYTQADIPAISVEQFINTLLPSAMPMLTNAAQQIPIPSFTGLSENLINRGMFGAWEAGIMHITLGDR
jgi:hypothetical protein